MTMKLLLRWILEFVLLSPCFLNLQDVIATGSTFCGRGKKTAWNTWKVYPEVIQAFEEFPLMQTETSNMAMEILKRFVVLLYDCTSDIINVNDSRKFLLTHKNRSLEKLPATQEVLKQHIKRAR